MASSHRKPRRRRLECVDPSEQSEAALNVMHNVDLFVSMFCQDDETDRFEGFDAESVVCSETHLQKLVEEQLRLTRDLPHYQERLSDVQEQLVKAQSTRPQTKTSVASNHGLKRTRTSNDEMDSDRLGCERKRFKSKSSLVSESVPSAIRSYADAISKKGSNDQEEKVQRKISRILASQWETRLRKVENKYVKTTTRSPSGSTPPSARTSATVSPSKPLISKPFSLSRPKLELNESHGPESNLVSVGSSTLRRTTVAKANNSNVKIANLRVPKQLSKTTTKSALDGNPSTNDCKTRGSIGSSCPVHQNGTREESFGPGELVKQSVAPNSQDASLSRPLFEGLSVESDESTPTPALSKSQTGQRSGNKAGEELGSELRHRRKSSNKSTKNMRNGKSKNVVHERLPNGWAKKAVQRMTGKTKGSWDIYLITPDQKLLRSQKELKLYIAKAGAIVDFNIVNFALPKNTAFTESKRIKDSEVMEEPVRKSGRESRLPFKLRDDNVDDKKENRQACHSVTTVASTRSPAKLSSPTKTPSSTLTTKPSSSLTTGTMKTNLTLATSGANQSDLKSINERIVGEGKLSTSFVVAKKSLPFNNNPNQPTIGVGTFSLGYSPSFASFTTTISKPTVACNTCVNCLKPDCAKCIYCKHNVETANRENKTIRTCLYRRCLNPQPLSESDQAQLVNPSFLTQANGSVLASKSFPSQDPSSRTVEKNQSSHGEKMGREMEEPLGTFAYSLEAFQSDLYQREVQKCKVAMTEKEEKPTEKPSTLDTIVIPTNDNKPSSKEQNDNAGKFKRPDHSMASLICIALQSLPEQRGTFGDIVNFIASKWPYFKEKTDQVIWHNSVRHNLSLRDEFVRSKSEKVGKQSIYTLHPEADLEALTLRARRNGIKISASTVFQESKETYVISSTETTPTVGNGLELACSDDSMCADKSNTEEKKNYSIEREEMSYTNNDESATNSEPDNKIVSITNDSKEPNEYSFCQGCNSSSSAEDLLTCALCSGGFHPFCVRPEDLVAPNDTWLCSKCISCVVCGKRDNTNRKRCDQCRQVFCSSCLMEDIPQLKDENGEPQPWMCRSCVKCYSCQVSTVSQVVSGKLACANCCLLLKEGNYCPLCERCYDDDDFDTRMIECATCGAWVHSDCENVDAEQYQVLSLLPDSVEYICRCNHSSVGARLKSNGLSHLGLRGVVAVPVTSFSQSDSDEQSEKGSIVSLKSASQIMPQLPNVSSAILEQD